MPDEQVCVAPEELCGGTRHRAAHRPVDAIELPLHRGSVRLSERRCPPIDVVADDGRLPVVVNTGDLTASVGCRPGVVAPGNGDQTACFVVLVLRDDVIDGGAGIHSSTSGAGAESKCLLIKSSMPRCRLRQACDSVRRPRMKCRTSVSQSREQPALIVQKLHSHVSA